MNKIHSINAVLCVEDGRFEMNYLCELICELIGEHNPQVLDRATSGAAALELCKTKCYDVIITDFNMPPGINGQEFALQVRDQACRSHEAVIALFSSDEADLARVKEAENQRAQSGNKKIFNGGVHKKPYSDDKLKEVFERCKPTPPVESKQPLK